MAIAFDNKATSNNLASSSLTFTHTCAGSNRVLVVGMTGRRINATNGNLVVTGITYGGASLINIDAVNRVGATNTTRSEIWYLNNPPLGANSVIINCTGTTDELCGMSISMTGVRQSTPDAHNNANNNGASASLSITTVAANAWIIDVVAVDQPGLAPSVTAGQTQRQSLALTDTADGNSNLLVVTPAATTVSWSFNSGNWAYTAASFAPMQAANGGALFF